jgi:hypothetical protein
MKTLQKSMLPRFQYLFFIFIFSRSRFHPKNNHISPKPTAKMFGTAYCLLLDINGGAAISLIPAKANNEQVGERRGNEYCPCGQEDCAHVASSSSTGQIRGTGISSQQSSKPPSPPVKYEYGSGRTSSTWTRVSYKTESGASGEWFFRVHSPGKVAS